MSSNRFSKQSVIDHLNRNIQYLEKEYGFTQDNGWAQVEKKGEKINREYGYYEALQQIRDDVEGGYL